MNKRKFLRAAGIGVGIFAGICILLLAAWWSLSWIMNRDSNQQISTPAPEEESVPAPDSRQEEWQRQRDEYNRKLWREDAIVIYIDEFLQVSKSGAHDITDRLIALLNVNDDDPEIFERIIVANSRDEKGRVAPAIIDHYFYDFDKDGKDELVIASHDAYINLEYPGYNGFHNGVSEAWNTVSVLKKTTNGYSVFYKDSLDTYATIFGGFIPERDLNGNGKPEMTFIVRGCGAHTCQSHLSINEWNGNEWRSLGSSENIGGSSMEFSFEDANKDGIKEITMTGGGIGSVGAGMQRNWTTVFTYDGKTGSYVKSGSYPAEPSEDPYFLMMDAYYALQRGEYVRAVEFAEQVLEKPVLETRCYVEDGMCKGPESYRIGAYAGIEAMLGYLSQKPANIARAEEIMNTLSKYHFTDETMGNNNPYISGAQRLLDTYKQTKDINAACKAMANTVIKNVHDAEFYDWYGYNQERITLDKICPFQ